MIPQNIDNHESSDVDKLLESRTVDDEALEERLLGSVSQAFSDFAQNQEFTNPDNRDMAMFVGEMLGRAFSNFVVAFKLTPYVPDLTVAVGAMKRSIDCVLECYKEEQESIRTSDLENISHNVL